MRILKRKYQTPVGCFEEIVLDEEKSLRIVLTGKCNLACEFCVYKIRDFYSPEVHSPKFIEMRQIKKLKNLLEKMKECLNYDIVHLTGGEPLLSRNIFKMAKMAKKIGFKTNICSNLIFIKPLLYLLQRELLNELTFSYFPLDSNGQRKNFSYYKKPDRLKIKKIMKNIIYLKSNFPNLIIKTNIIINPFTDINNLAEFVYWCWENDIVPSIQRDRSLNRILGSNKKTLNLIKALNVKPKRVILKIPGATEICEFRSLLGKKIYVKIFNKNFRPDKICKFCYKKGRCHKSLSNIRIYDTENGPVMCFCTEYDKDFAHWHSPQI